MSVKPAHSIMTDPLSVDPTREFRITGTVKSVEKDLKITKMKVLHVDHHKFDDNITEFDIQITRNTARVFANKYVMYDDLVVVYGELQMKKGSIVLDANYIMTFRGMQNIWDHPEPIYVDPNDVPTAEDNAY